MSDIRRVQPGVRMSQAVSYGGMVWLAGQVGAPGESVTAQTEAILAKIEGLLGAAGTDKSRLLQATIWLTSIDDFDEMNAVWDAWVDPRNPPARACGESRLARPELLVEVIVVAAL